MDDQHSSAPPSRVVNLSPDMTNADALQRIGLSCIRLMQHYEPIALDGNGEGVHQMRVSVRRLRVSISVFRDGMRRDQRKWIDRELQWFADVLGECRDLDVFESELIEKKGAPVNGEITDLAKRTKKSAYERMRRAIRSPRYVALKIGLRAGFEIGNWINSAGFMKHALIDTAPNILDRRYKKARYLCKNFSNAGEKRRHRLRISLKKLRYTSELLGVVFDDKKVLDFTSQLKDLQDDLGEANDVKMGRSIVTEMVQRRANLELANAGHQLLGFHERRVDENETKMYRHLHRFLDTPPFWH